MEREHVIVTNFPLYISKLSITAGARRHMHATHYAPATKRQKLGRRRPGNKATQCGAYVDEFLSGVEIGHQPVLSFWERRQGDLHFAANQAVCVFR